MFSNDSESRSVDERRSRVPGVPGAGEYGVDMADDFEPSVPSTTEEDDTDLPATETGGDPFPVSGSGPRSEK